MFCSRAVFLLIKIHVFSVTVGTAVMFIACSFHLLTFDLKKFN